MPDVLIPGHQCSQCGHRWVPRKKKLAKKCPRCQSAEWDHGRYIEPIGALQDAQVLEPAASR